VEHIDRNVVSRFDTRSSRPCEFCREFDPQFPARRALDQMVSGSRKAICFRPFDRGRLRPSPDAGTAPVNFPRPPHRSLTLLDRLGRQVMRATSAAVASSNR